MTQNGQLPKSVLSPVASAGGKHNQLADTAAASANTFRLFCLANGLGDWYSEGPQGDYRDLKHQQVAWDIYQRDGAPLAAVVGTSNHGWGVARDLATPAMRAAVDGHGAAFGWRKTEAFSEWWHVNYVGGFHRPDPGIDVKNPLLGVGSGGPGLAHFVVIVQKKLDVAADGEFGKHTREALEAFQRKHHLRADGTVGPNVWKAIRA